jgi:hypothetical protein
MKNVFLALLAFYLLPLQGYAATAWPEVVEELSQAPQKCAATAVVGGASNVNYHFILDDTHYFARFAPKSVASLYADLGVEQEVLELVSKLGVCAKPHYYDRDKRVLVTDFIHHEEEIDLLDPATRLEIFQMLHTIDAGR